MEEKKSLNGFKSKQSCLRTFLALGVPWQSDGLATCLGIKIARPIVSGSAFGLTFRPSAKVQCVARPMLNTSHHITSHRTVLEHHYEIFLFFALSVIK